MSFTAELLPSGPPCSLASASASVLSLVSQGGMGDAAGAAESSRSALGPSFPTSSPSRSTLARRKGLTEREESLVHWGVVFLEEGLGREIFNAAPPATASTVEDTFASETFKVVS
ncbi:hypothetical protein BDP27DRAFT_1422163 [Rhodocollybia butyracea]|uniref:Uncharacterized protein n=1 Tax=Rhodocollybia butyracea TaxID=206335 RepID=A0A9P5PUA9_9AGAR|nr:hypothetical protein BDP27DRAFT_1422163 [Rhodocollybia butyracea]